MSAGAIDLAAMQDAARRYIEAKAVGDTTAQRTAIADTLSVLMNATRAALAETDGSIALRRPLLDLIAALEDLNEGRSTDLLRSGKRSKAGAGGLAHMKVEAYAEAAAAVTMLVQSKTMKEAEAIKHVKRRLSVGGVKLPSDFATMRDKVVSGARGERAREAHAAVLNTLRRREQAPEQVVNAWLDLMIGVHGTKKLPQSAY